MKTLLKKIVIIAFKLIMLILFGFACFSYGVNMEKMAYKPKEHNWLNQLISQTKQITDRIKTKDIVVYEDKVIIYGSFEWGDYMDTDSMLPLLDYGSNGLYFSINNTTDLYLGDVVSYTLPGISNPIIHRIVDINRDKKGIYYITKGDNIKQPDPYKVRKEEIERVLVGVIW